MDYKSIHKKKLGSRFVFIVENEIERNRGSNDLLGKIVSVDGDNYLIKGVESYAMEIIRKGDLIGLLVEELTYE